MEFKNTKYLKNAEVELRLREAVESVEKFGGVPVYYFDILNCDGDKVGTCELRVGHNDELYYYGNILCEIEPRYQGRHFAFKATRLLLLLAKDHNMGYISVTCAKDNVKIKSTCNMLGMQLLEVCDLPLDHPIRNIGGKDAAIYVLDF